MKKRRKKGTGSIAQRADGIWQFSIDLGKDTDGRRQRVHFYAASRAAVLRKVADERAAGGLRPRAKGTVAEWVERWLRDDVKPNRSPNTYAQYESVWRVHAAPLLLRLSLQKLDVEHVERLYSSLRDRGVSSAIVQRVSVVLARAIQVAIKRGYYLKRNPFVVVDKPAHHAKEAKALSLKEARRFLAAAQGTRFEALWIVLLTSGLRLGEALGLEWHDVDFDKGTLSVRQGLQEVNGYSRVGKLKTPSSKRLVKLGAFATAALLRRKDAAKSEKGHNSPFIFTTSTGGHPRRSNLRQKYFQPICETARITGLTIHGLRHSMTSLALSEGVPTKTVSSRLGHMTTRMTLDRYGHVIDGADEAAAEAIDGLFERS